MKFYVSFGQTHVHSMNGVTIDKDCVVEIEAGTYNRAREAALSMFGVKFSRVYSDPELAFFTRGIIRLAEPLAGTEE